MSYILDALKKSEQERAGAPSPQDDNGARAQSLRPLWIKTAAVALALNIALIAGAVGWFSQREVAAPVIATPAPTPQAPPLSAPLTPDYATPAMRPRTEKIEPRDLLEEARVEEARAPSAAEVPEKPERHPSAPVAATPAPVAIDYAPRLDTAVPLLRQMPPDFQRALPPMAVNIHVYSPNTAQSILYINNRQYRAGEVVENSVRLEAIVPDGAVLSYNGQQFKLARPN